MGLGGPARASPNAVSACSGVDESPASQHIHGYYDKPAIEVMTRAPIACLASNPAAMPLCLGRPSYSQRVVFLGLGILIRYSRGISRRPVRF